MKTTRTIILTAIACSFALACEVEEAPVPEELASIDACAINAPVCGTDGITYANTCTAQLEGATIAKQTPCGCGAGLAKDAVPSQVAGTWTASQPWPIQVVLQNGNITRYDYTTNCAGGLGCITSEPAVSTGTYKISGALIHLNWTKPASVPGINLPSLYLYEAECDDGDTYLVQLTPYEVFYGKQ